VQPNQSDRKENGTMNYCNECGEPFTPAGFEWIGRKPGDWNTCVWKCHMEGCDGRVTIEY